MMGRFIAVILVFILWIVTAGLLAQSPPRTAASDSTGNADSVRMSQNMDYGEGEIILDDIDITGKVEKPGVIIMPKRIEPELDEVTLQRSFEKEVKESMAEMPKPKSVLHDIDHVKSIKKTVEKKRDE